MHIREDFIEYLLSIYIYFVIIYFVKSFVCKVEKENVIVHCFREMSVAKIH